MNGYLRIRIILIKEITSQSVFCFSSFMNYRVWASNWITILDTSSLYKIHSLHFSNSRKRDGLWNELLCFSAQSVQFYPRVIIWWFLILFQRMIVFPLQMTNELFAKQINFMLTVCDCYNILLNGELHKISQKVRNTTSNLSSDCTNKRLSVI